MSMNCLYCGKALPQNGGNAPQLRFCPYCGKPIASVPQMKAAQQKQAPPQVQAPASKPVTPQDGAEELKIEPAEYETAERGTVFLNEKQEPVLHGWLPEGFVPAGDLEPNPGDLDCPLALWARAQHPAGKEWFCRRYKRIEIDKADKSKPNPFLPYDEYFDDNARTLLSTASLRVILRMPPTDEDMRKLRETLTKRQQQLEALSSEYSQTIVQGEYGALGGKLYEAEINGKKKYLFLHTYVLADEYGFFNKHLYESQMQTERMLQSMRSMAGGLFSSPFGMQLPTTQMPSIDTDPKTPFGRHRTDGLSPNKIYWNIISLSGCLSDTKPTREELCDFLRFVHSLQIAPELQKMIEQFQQQAVAQKMMTQQAIFSTMQQGMAQRQREMDRHNAVMRGIHADMDAIQQQHLANQNAAFDRSVQRSHEMAMGVDTYQRTDGTTVEVDVSVDRVFQHTADPSMIVGASTTADVPFGWTELKKLLYFVADREPPFSQEI